MTTLRTLLAVAVCTLAVAGSAHAEGWSLTSWIPGQKDEAKSKTTTSRIPLLGGKPLRSTTKSTGNSQPGMWSRMSSGTSKMWSRTKDALTWNDEPEPRSRGAHKYWDDSSSSRKRKDEESSFFSWFQRDEPRPSKTVQGFLSQKRPGETDD